MLAQGPQGIEGTEPPQHGPQRGRHAGLVCVRMEPPHHGELQECQGQGAAVIHLETDHRQAVIASGQLGPATAPVAGGH